jgi:hypothetical protein
MGAENSRSQLFIISESRIEKVNGNKKGTDKTSSAPFFTSRD